MAYGLERRTAIEAVVKACHLCIQVQNNLIDEQSMAKKDKSPVTVADFGAQAVVTRYLQAAFAGDPLVGEEDAGELRDPANATLRQQVVNAVATIIPGLGEEQVLGLLDRGAHEGGAAGRHWTLDPIDGTKGFLRKEQYAVALALIENGKVVLGVLGCPNLPVDANRPEGAKGCIFIATRGEGATMRTIDDPTERRIGVTSITDPAQARICESVESAHSSQSDSAVVAEKLGVKVEPFRIDSQCKYAAVARGDASIYLRLPTKKGYEEKIWDHAAGAIVIEEAGGTVTDIHGKPLDFSLGRTLRDNTGVIVTNGKIHEPVLKAVQSALGV